MKINSYILKLTGNAELPKELSETQNLKVTLDGTITEIAYKDNDNGTHDCVYKFKPVLVETMSQDREIIKAKDTRSNSELQRAQIIAIWNELKPNCDRDEFYDKVMLAYRHHATKISEEVIKFNNW